VEIAFYFIVGFLFLLAVLDLFVGVANDAVNFLSSAVGSRAATYKRIMIVACLGIIIGASFSNGMMEIARKGIFNPQYFFFEEVMCIFLAVAVSDVILLDIFNSLGLPTSTTVSLVFELLGASFCIALFKLSGNMAGMSLADLLNTDKALTVILAIFLSVAIAFVFGLVVQWLARLLFTFNFRHASAFKTALFDGVAATSILYFMFFKGMRDATFMTAEMNQWMDAHIGMLVVVSFVATAALFFLLEKLHVKTLKLVVLLGTFALALAFAGNDLVNFIGVTMAGLSSFNYFMDSNPAGLPADQYPMDLLNSPAKTPMVFLIGAGLVMIISLITSRKARHVLQTSIDLSRQDEGDEMFGTSRIARRMVRSTTTLVNAVVSLTPDSVKHWVNKRFDSSNPSIDDGAAFDMVRASVNLVMSGLLIAVGTSLKLPLSTTYVSFIVAMGTSLADRAWGRESAVFRVTGVVSVIGGWFITAGAAFLLAAVVVALMHFGGIFMMIAMIILAIVLLYRSHKSYKKKEEKAAADVVMTRMMATDDPAEVFTLLRDHTAGTLSHTISFVGETYSKMFRAFTDEDVKALHSAMGLIMEEKAWMKKMRRKEIRGLQRMDGEQAFRMNTWYHLSSTSSQQLLNTLNRICDPMKEHTDNNFRPLPSAYVEEFEPYCKQIEEFFSSVSRMISSEEFVGAEELSESGKLLKKQLSNLRKAQTDRLQTEQDNLKAALVYLNIIQESHELMSEVRNVLRGAEKFFDVK